MQKIKSLTESLTPEDRKQLIDLAYAQRRAAMMVYRNAENLLIALGEIESPTISTRSEKRDQLTGMVQLVN